MARDLFGASGPIAPRQRPKADPSAPSPLAKLGNPSGEWLADWAVELRMWDYQNTQITIASVAAHFDLTDGGLVEERLRGLTRMGVIDMHVARHEDGTFSHYYWDSGEEE